MHNNSSGNSEESQFRQLITKISQRVSLRQAIQAFIVLVLIYATWEFYGFYQYVQGNAASTGYRPGAVEGFLPIAAIVAFKAMFTTWEIDPIHPAGLVIFLAILITGWIFRRALCSWICPIGTLSEYMGKLGKRVLGRNLKIPKWLDVILLIVKFGLFLFIVKSIISLSASDAIGFMQLPYYAISDIKMFELFLNIGLKGILFIGTLIALSFLFKSFWCRYLCPYGALVGILGVCSPFVLKKDENNCIKCDQCNKACPNNVNIMDKKSVVISTECTGCTACVSACPKPNTLAFKLFGFLPVKPLTFSLCFIVVFFGIIVWAIMTGHWDSNVDLPVFKSLYQSSGSF